MNTTCIRENRPMFLTYPIALYFLSCLFLTSPDKKPSKIKNSTDFEETLVQAVRKIL